MHFDCHRSAHFLTPPPHPPAPTLPPTLPKMNTYRGQSYVIPFCNWINSARYFIRFTFCDYWMCVRVMTVLVTHLSSPANGESRPESRLSECCDVDEGRVEERAESRD